MSSSSLYVEFADGSRLWGIYHGTSDTILRRLFDTEDQAEDAYFTEDRQEGFNAMRVDQRALERAQASAEPVRFFTGYGVRDGSYEELGWEGRASRSAKVVIGPLSHEEAWLDQGRT